MNWLVWTAVGTEREHLGEARLRRGRGMTMFIVARDSQVDLSWLPLRLPNQRVSGQVLD